MVDDRAGAPRWVRLTPLVAGWAVLVVSVGLLVAELADDREVAHLIEDAAFACIGVALVNHERVPRLSRAMAWPVLGLGVSLIVLAGADMDRGSSVPVGIAFLAFALARGLCGHCRRWLGRIGDAGAAVFASVVITVLLEYVYEAPRDGTTVDHLHTSGVAAGLLTVVLIGLLACRAEGFPLSLLLDKGPAGTLTRNLLPAVILVPALLVQFHDYVERQGRVSSGLSLAVLTGGMIVVLTAVVSVTARSLRRTFEDLHRVNQELEAVFSSMPAVVTLTDLDNHFLRTSAYAQQTMRPRGGELTGRNALDFYPADIRDDVIEQGRLAAEEGLTSMREYRTLFGGRERIWELTRFPVSDADGRPIGVGTVGLDITESRRAERLAAAASDRLRSYLDAAPDATIMVDGTGIIQFANIRVGELLGYDPGELAGRNVDQLVPGAVRPDHAGLRAAYMSRPRHRAMGSGKELLALRKDGSTVPVEISLGPVKTDDGTWIAAALRDVTERRAAEAALRDAEQRARHLADHDPLTGAANRRLFESELAQHLMTGKCDTGGLLIIDVDHFKEVNDTVGHSAGDSLLVDVVRALEGCLPPGASLSRLGGDEFALLLVDGGPGEVEQVAQQAVRAIRAIGEDPMATYPATASIGAAPFASLPDAERTNQGALVHADDALYAAKAGGRDQCVMWSPETRRLRLPSRHATLDQNGHRQRPDREVQEER